MDLLFEPHLSLEAPAPQTHNMQQAADNVAHTREVSHYHFQDVYMNDKSIKCHFPCTLYMMM